MSYVEKATAYAQAVVRGDIPACKWVRLSCQRQLDDLERYADHPLFLWSPAHAERVCRFIERLQHVKGPKAGEFIELEGWQCFALTSAFGWRRKDTGGRRFRRIYIEVPRGNAKSTLSSGVALYCLTADGEAGPDVYSAATTRDQARIVYGDAFQMLRRRPDFTAKLGVKLPRTMQTHSPILHEPSGGRFLPLSREGSNLDGLNIHCAIVDELHAHKTREVYDVLVTGAGKRTASLIWCITTAGTDMSGICYEIRGHLLKTLERIVQDEALFGIVYTVDEGDAWDDPAVWRKANPNWGVSVMPDHFEQLAHVAMSQLSAQNNFKTKHLCVWTNAAIQWMDMRAWERCGDVTLDPEQFRDAPLFLGLDLATKTDVASLARMFLRWRPVWSQGCAEHKAPGTWDCSTCYVADGPLEPHFYLFVRHFLPEAALHDGRNSQYSGWALGGWLTETPGDVLDFAAIKEAVTADQDGHQLRECAYDPWQATQLAQELYAQGVQTVEIRATVQNFSAPMKELEALVLGRRLHHNADPVLRWMVSNVVCFRDAKDNIYPRKEQPNNKIDGVVAAIMALSRAVTEPSPSASAGIRFL